MEEFKEYVIVMVALAGPWAGTMLRRYRAPDSRHFGGLVEIMRHLADSKDTPELDARLEQEGWTPLAELQGLMAPGRPPP
jgi:hypothetical protein